MFYQCSWWMLIWPGLMHSKLPARSYTSWTIERGSKIQSLAQCCCCIHYSQGDIEDPRLRSRIQGRNFHWFGECNIYLRMSWKSWRPVGYFNWHFASNISSLYKLRKYQLKKGISAQYSSYSPGYLDCIDFEHCARQGRDYNNYSLVTPSFVRRHLQYSLAIKVQNFWSLWARRVGFHPTSSPSSQAHLQTSNLSCICH